MFSSDLPLFDGRYKVLSMIGQGTFSQLFLAEDRFSAIRRRVALKVMNTKYTYVGLQVRVALVSIANSFNASLQECQRIAALNTADPRAKFSVVRFYHAFYFDDHLCIVLELLDCSLLEYMVRAALMSLAHRSC
jgi:serine/threonine protein kinase